MSKKIKQGDLLKWQKEGAELIFLVTDNDQNGVVIHSVGLVARLGSIWNMSAFSNQELLPYKGSVTLTAK